MVSAALILSVLGGLTLYVCHLIVVELTRAFPRYAPMWWLRYIPYAALLFCLLWWAAAGNPS